MSKINAYAALMLVTVLAPAFGQIGPMTIQEWGSRQADFKRAEMDAKLDEQRRKINGQNTPAQIARTCDDEISMYAVYGMGSKLRADFGFRGVTVTLAPGENVEVGGWYVEELTPTRALMVKRSGKKIISRCPVYLSTSVKAVAPLGTTAAGGSDGTLQVPPITPMPGETNAKPVSAVKLQAPQGAPR